MRRSNREWSMVSLMARVGNGYGSVVRLCLSDNVLMDCTTCHEWSAVRFDHCHHDRNLPERIH